MPSIFPRKGSSPRKGPPPTYRSEPYLFPRKSKNTKMMYYITLTQPIFSARRLKLLPVPVPAMIQKPRNWVLNHWRRQKLLLPLSQSSSEMSENVNKDSFISKLQDRLDEVVSDKEKLEEKVSQLKEKSTNMLGIFFANPAAERIVYYFRRGCF